MKNSAFLIPAVLLFVFVSLCSADTFTNRDANEILHGYATSQTEDSNTVVVTKEKGPVKLNLSEWTVEQNRLGRNNKVIVLTIDEDIALELESNALKRALSESADQGPLFILLHLDTPGGRNDVSQQICTAIQENKNCPVIAFVTGEKNGGAISAGAQVAFACDKIYMTKNSVIGAATSITFSREGKPISLTEALGEEVAAKFSSAWQAKLASLAEQKGRPGLLARAMVDRNVEVIEVSDNGKRAFIDPVNKAAEQEIVRTWNKKGSLLTLTAEEAVKCTIADKIVNSQSELLADQNAPNAQIITNDAIQQARKDFRKIELRFEALKKSIDFKSKQLEHQQVRARALGILRDLVRDYKAIITLAKRYPDLPVNIPAAEKELNSIEALYTEAKVKR